MSVCEVSLQLASGHDELLAFLQETGIHDYVEGSCDFLDCEEDEAAAYLERFEAGDLSLPVLVYSSEPSFVQALESKAVARFGPRLSIKLTWLADALWREAWEPGFRFLESRRFIIGPEDLTIDTTKTRISLASGNIFGSGQHATTQAMVRLLESVPRPESDRSLLDVGTGTGVLAFVAEHLGYAPVEGTDIEAEAIALAQANACRNRSEACFHLGSLPPEPRLWGSILCNILPPTLTGLLPHLDALLTEEGALYLAGFHEANAETIREALTVLDFVVVEEVKERAWIAWLAKRRSASRMIKE